MRFLPPVALAFAVLVVTVAATWQITRSPDDLDDVDPYVQASAPSGEPVLITVAEGEGSQEIGERLEQSGVVESAAQFRVLVSFLGYDGILQAGEYEFETGTPPLDAVYRMRRGIVSTRSVTVIEGWRLEEIADAVAAEGIPRDEFIAASRARPYEFEFLQSLRSSQSVEGYLYPARYSIRKTDSATALIQRMLQAFSDNATPYLQTGADAGLTAHEIVTLASIIEREAQVPSERPIMAQVFLSRIAQGIPLEADPTVQYAVSADPQSVAAHGYWKQGLTSADLRSNSPYNTYQVEGLPPGPICSPGLDSILAVMNPADTNFLYFVAVSDGSHLFAETFQEHLQNINDVEG